MGHKSSSAVLVGLGAAVGAFAAAAILSAATAPTARADDYSTIIADVQAEEADAATAFANASTDGYDTAAGLTQYFIGLDDDLYGVANIVEVGSVDELTGATIPSLASDYPAGFEFDFAAPATLTAAVTEAQTYYAAGTALTNVIDGLPTSDYADTALDNALSTIDQYVLPEQIELIANLAYAF